MIKTYIMSRLEVKDEFSFELYPEIKEGVILEALKGECITYDLPQEVYEVLIEAWNSRFWVTEGYDGATVIKNKKHPSISNFFHDYFYRGGYASNYKDGKKVDLIYKSMLKLTGYKSGVSNRRYWIIRGFGSFLRIGHRWKGNKKEPSEAMKNLYFKLRM